MLIHRLKVSGLLSFGPTGIDLPLEPLNVLIGPNGSGKSNLLEVLALLKAAPSRLAQPVHSMGGIENWLWKGSGATERACVEASVEHPSRHAPLSHRFAIRNHGGRFELSDETINDPATLYAFREGHPVLTDGDGQERELKKENLGPEASILSQVKDPERYPALHWLQSQYEAMAFFRSWSFGPYADHRQGSSLHDSGANLAEGATNLALVLSQTLLKAKPQLIDSLRILIDDVQDLQIVPSNGTAQIFLDEGQGRQIPATRLSDGTLRYLALLTILHHPSPPPLVAIEEPELGMHPDVIPHLGELLVRASQRTQLVVTTHSRALVDALSEVPSSVVVCSKENGESVFERLDGERLKAWLNDYSLGELWSMGELGGNRW